MSQLTSWALIEFPLNLITEDIKEYLQDEHRVSLEALEKEGYEDAGIEDDIFWLHDNYMKNGEFEELEELLVKHQIPFDRETGMEYQIYPRRRIFRPDGLDREFELDSNNDQMVVSVAKIREIMAHSNTKRGAAFAIEEYLDEHFPKYQPLSDWVKEA